MRVDLRAEASRRAVERVAACQERRLRLRAGIPIEPADAQRASEALERAQRRYVLAALRLLELRAPSPLPLAPSATGDLFDQYVALTGSSSRFDVDAYLHGMTGLGKPERDILTQAAWELSELGPEPGTDPSAGTDPSEGTDPPAAPSAP